MPHHYNDYVSNSHTHKFGHYSLDLSYQPQITVSAGAFRFVPDETPARPYSMEVTRVERLPRDGRDPYDKDSVEVELSIRGAFVVEEAPYPGFAPDTLRFDRLCLRAGLPHRERLPREVRAAKARPRD